MAFHDREYIEGFAEAGSEETVEHLTRTDADLRLVGSADDVAWT